MKLNKFVCVFVTGQENINGQSDTFAIQLSFNQVSRGWKFNQLGFAVLEFNQLGFTVLEFSQSGFLGPVV